MLRLLPWEVLPSAFCWVVASVVNPSLSLVSYISGLGLWPYTLEGNIVILKIIDCFSKSVHDVSLPKLPSAPETARLLICHVFRLRYPTRHCFRGPQFASQVWREFCKSVGSTALRRATLHHPVYPTFHTLSLRSTHSPVHPLACLTSCVSATNPLFFPEQVEAVAC